MRKRLYGSPRHRWNKCSSTYCCRPSPGVGGLYRYSRRLCMRLISNLYSEELQLRHKVYCSRYEQWPTQPPVQWVPGVKLSSSDVDHPPPSSAEVKERVELYFYSPSRASMDCSWVNFKNAGTRLGTTMKRGYADCTIAPETICELRFTQQQTQDKDILSTNFFLLVLGPLNQGLTTGCKCDTNEETRNCAEFW